MATADSPEGVIQDFVYMANTVYGVYLDASMAIGNLSFSYINYHSDHIAKLKESGQPLTPDLVNPSLVYNAGPEGQQKPIHKTTLVDIIERNRLDGRHMQFLARMCVVALYQYWEDQFRPRLKAALGHEVKHDTFGELRNLRRSVIHRGARALPELALCKALPRFQPDADIVLDHAAMDQIMTAVKQAALELLVDQS